MSEQRQQRLPEAVDIGQQDRLAVPSELLPGELLDQFLQRADPAGQGDERIRSLEHQSLALMHVARDDHLLHARQRMFTRGQEVRNDAGDGAAVVEDGCRDGAHQADRAAAIDQPDLVSGERFTKGDGGFDEVGICTGA